MEIKFSSQGTGACPLCRNFKNCKILAKTGASLKKTVKEKHDEVMEVVIYRCPEFTEIAHQEDSVPFN